MVLYFILLIKVKYKCVNIYKSITSKVTKKTTIETGLEFYIIILISMIILKHIISIASILLEY